MVHQYQIDGLTVQTGDLICTADGDPSDVQGRLWRLIGKLVPGEVDHIAVNVGPEGRCVEAAVREGVASYCLQQAELGRPYNLNFLDSATERSFYCSQLAYRAYLRHSIDLNTGMGIRELPGTQSIVFPEEIWKGCVHRRKG